MTSKSISDRLEQLAENPKPRKMTIKQNIKDNFDLIIKCLNNGWSYDDIAEKINTNASLPVTVATLRRYIYDIRIQQEAASRED